MCKGRGSSAKPGAQHIVQGLGRVLHNIMAGGSRSHLPLTFWGLGRMHSSWWRNKRYEIIVCLCLRWVFWGVAHPALDSMFTPNNEWCHEGAGLFIGFK